MRLLALIVLALCSFAHAQSLTETFDWMTNTLKPGEGNDTVVHRPFKKPYPADWVRDDLDPYHLETITKFSFAGCKVEFDVDVTDNDILLGRYFVTHETDTFDLKDIDPNSIRIEDACEAFEAASGPTTAFNCKDEQGKFLILRTSDAKAKIHEESSGASGNSAYSDRHKDERDPTKTKGDVLAELCKKMPGNSAYCAQPEHKIGSEDLTHIQLGFRTPEYAGRFAKALRQAVDIAAAHVPEPAQTGHDVELRLAAAGDDSN
jgi:hypothetical protein